MYCKHCGKELSDEAPMCPDCGTPTGAKPKPKTRNTGERSPLGAITLFLAIFSFVTGIIFGAFFYARAETIILLYTVGAFTILPGLAAVCIGIAVLYLGASERDRNFAITSIVLAGVALFFLFVAYCVIAGISL